MQSQGYFLSLNNHLVLLNEGSISLTVHYCMTLRVGCNLLMVSYVNIRFVKALLKYEYMIYSESIYN